MKDIIIETDQTLRNTLKKLDEGAEKILYVVDSDNNLIGAISDGDIRRAILHNVNLEDTIVNIFNTNPKSIEISFYTDELCKSIMLENKISSLPIVNKGKIVDIKFWNQIFDTHFTKQQFNKFKIPVVIMAGGKGSRMEPFTTVLPKPLIPIGNETILEKIMHEFHNYGIDEFNLTLNYKGEMIKSYFNCIEHKYQLNYYNETDFYGTAGSLALLKDDIQEPFFVTNCDIIVKADLYDVFNFHKKNSSFLTIISSIQHYKIPYGVIEYENGGKVINIKEKPEYSFPVNTGVYILSPECFDYIPKNKYYDMPTLIEDLMKDNKKVMTYPINENDYVDIGQWEEYHNAVRRMTL